ncbi:MAG: histidinol-phosphate transaminase [Paludibacteraceae bacterium]|nr:histidinol-phosphate transaminase [Paludibacteraceae bacterium]
MRDLKDLVRKNVWALKPYSCARDEFKGEASVYLDANENPRNNPYNRYPDPLQWEVKKRLEQVKGVKAENILLGNGSDEPIDLMYRAFCEPRIDNVVAICPTYGMYQVCADVNDVEYRSVNLKEGYELDVDGLLAATDKNTKVVWLCSPNNPTGNSLKTADIERVLKEFDGIVVLDEAYSDFASAPSFKTRLSEFPNIVILQTFSKAWASAAVRLGMAFASTDIISVLNKIKYPYNVNKLTQEYALDILKDPKKIEDWVEQTIQLRGKLEKDLRKLSFVVDVFKSDANFVLAKMTNAQAVYEYLVGKGIIVRNRNRVTLCSECIRITVGTAEENAELMGALNEFAF